MAAKETAAQKKRAEKEKIQSTIDRLSIIYDKVQKSKRADRYIVGNKDDSWGVVNSDGEIIIPFNYTRITTSNDTFFRAYGEFDIRFASMYSSVKEQSIIDYNGNVLVGPMCFSKNLLVGKYGILLGQDASCYTPDDYEHPYQIWFVHYNNGIVSLGDDIKEARFNVNMPELIFLLNADNKIVNTIRADKEAKILELKDSFDAITPIDEFDMTQQEKYFTDKMYRFKDKADETFVDFVNKLCDGKKMGKAQICRVGSHYIATDSEFSPISYLYMDNSKKSIKVIFNK